MTTSIDEADQSRLQGTEHELQMHRDFLEDRRLLSVLSRLGARLDTETSSSQSVDKLASLQEPQSDAQRLESYRSPLSKYKTWHWY